MAKMRVGDPWMKADAYGRSLPSFTVNLIARDIPRSVEFYRDVLGAKVVYSDPDFAAFELAGVPFMLHADHTYDQHPWHKPLLAGEKRGFGAELRVLGVNPDEVEARAKQKGVTVLQPAVDQDHGWRDVIVVDPDGYTWGVGVPLEAKKEA